MIKLDPDLLKSKLARVALSLFLLWAILLLGSQLLRMLQALLSPLQGVLVPLLAGFAIAYLLDPLADRLERFMSRGAAVAAISTMGLLAVAVALAVILPIFVNQAVALFKNAPDYYERLSGVVGNWTSTVKTEYPELYGRIVQEAKDLLAGMEWGKLLAPAVDQGQHVLSQLGAALAFVVGLLIIPVIAVYLLNDIDNIKDWMAEAIPPRWRDWILTRAREVDLVMGKFVRGYVLVSTSLAVIYSTGLGLLQTPMWLFVGISAGILYIIPYVGTGIGLVLALGLTMADYGLDWIRILAVLGVFGAGQFIESWFLTPRLLGKEVGLHPVVVILSVILGGQLFGVVGMLLALPATAVVRVFAVEGMRQVRMTKLYQEDGDVESA